MLLLVWFVVAQIWFVKVVVACRVQDTRQELIFDGWTPPRLRSWLRRRVLKQLHAILIDLALLIRLFDLFWFDYFQYSLHLNNRTVFITVIPLGTALLTDHREALLAHTTLIWFIQWFLHYLLLLFLFNGFWFYFFGNFRLHHLLHFGLQHFCLKLFFCLFICLFLGSLGFLFLDDGLPVGDSSDHDCGRVLFFRHLRIFYWHWRTWLLLWFLLVYGSWSRFIPFK